MGIPLQIFTLYCLQNLQKQETNCQHYLLLRVEQAGFNNADEGEYDHVVAIAEQKRSALIAQYTAEILAPACADSHEISLVGELQSSPTGDELFSETGGFYLDLWIAETRFGHPWVVMGTATNEAAFWQEVEQEEDLESLGAMRPARQQRTFFLTQNEIAESAASGAGTREQKELT
jgi:hypothetical protein